MLANLPGHPEIPKSKCGKRPADQRRKDRAEEILANEVEKVAHADWTR